MRPSRFPVPASAVRLLALVCTLAAAFAPAAAAADKKLVLIAGKPSHPPGAHEHRAGMLLLQKCLAGFPGLTVVVHDGGWPSRLADGQRTDDHAALADADAIVIYSDGGLKHPALEGDRLAVLARHVARGRGFGTLHYAVEPTKDKGQTEFLRWIGGAFETHWSVNPHWDAEFKDFPAHPVTRGVQPYVIRDEWYFNMRFRPGAPGGAGVTSILSAVAPATTMSRPDGAHSGNPAVRALVAQAARQTVAWAAENPDGSRGFGFTGGHYHANWKHEDQRRLVLNALVWLAGLEVPAGGVVSTVTDADLAANLDPKPAPKKKQ